MKSEAERFQRICEVLSEHYPKTELENKRIAILEAIFILLSSQTNENKYFQTWRSFRKNFPRLEDVLCSSPEAIFRAIKDGGLGEWKAKRIWNLLNQVKKKYGRLSLSSLKVLDDYELEKELLKLDGIGIKSARCIMMYSFNRDVFPVDTHVLRITRRLGFVIPRYHYRSKKFADAIQDQVPVGYRHRFHVNLVQHGRAICKTRPHCSVCPINYLCQYRIKASKHRNDDSNK